jgi:hypothetical protein
MTVRALDCNPKLAEIIQTEAQRVAALVAEDVAYRAEESYGRIDHRTGEVLRVRPTELTTARRLAASNGMPTEETTDTIGKLWAWGLLEHPEFANDLLRDAGRRYAASYWRRYGDVCARGSAYAEMTGRSSGGPPSVVIPDEALDLLAEQRFRSRDDALRDVSAKRAVDVVCVDGAGDNDPAWLVDLMTGYPRETRDLRMNLAAKASAIGSGTKDEQRRAERLHDDARRALDREVRVLRGALLPHPQVACIVTGLAELARIDRADGFHRPKRGRKEDD